MTSLSPTSVWFRLSPWAKVSRTPHCSAWCQGGQCDSAAPVVMWFVSTAWCSCPREKRWAFVEINNYWVYECLWGLEVKLHGKPWLMNDLSYMYIYIYIRVYIYSRGSYLVQIAIDGVFLPRSPVKSRLLGDVIRREVCRVGFDQRNPKPETRNRLLKLASNCETRNPKPTEKAGFNRRNPKPETRNRLESDFWVALRIGTLFWGLTSFSNAALVFNS